MARFIEMSKENSLQKSKEKKMHENDEKMTEKVETLISQVTKSLDKYDFNHAAQNLYDFIWHEFADIYIEDVKTRIDTNSYMVISELYLNLLKLLHPFMPFVTEEIYKRLWNREDHLIISNWPKYEKEESK